MYRLYNKILAENKNDGDFYDKMSKKWSETFAASYNKDIDLDNSVDDNTKENLMEVKDHINPEHYKEIAAGKQYIELMEELLEGFKGIEAHLLGQIYKYAMRLGKKDPKEKDSAKISWYAQCLADYYKTGTVKTGWK
jgi:hypothetical protein